MQMQRTCSLSKKKRIINVYISATKTTIINNCIIYNELFSSFLLYKTLFLNMDNIGKCVMEHINQFYNEITGQVIQQ